MLRKRNKKNRFPLGLVFGFGIFIVIASLIYTAILNTNNPPCANSRSCEESLSLKIDNTSEGIFLNHKVDVPQIDINNTQTAVLGVDEEIDIDAAEEKHIYVNLKTQMLSAYDGDELFMETPVSTGLWGKTPTGEFTIWIKLRSTTMSGGSGADYYNLPNVPHVMFFSNSEVAASRGFSIHGTYWHNNFGHPMSHGCVNMKATDVAKLYDWATPVSTEHSTHSTKMNPGTKITIQDGESEINVSP